MVLMSVMTVYLMKQLCALKELHQLSASHGLGFYVPSCTPPYRLEHNPLV